MAKYYEKGDNFVLFGDGTQALLAEWLPYLDPVSGKSFIRFLLWPSKEQVNRYNLINDEDIDHETGLTLQEYEKGYVNFLEMNPTKMRIFVEVSFDGKPTNMSGKHEDMICTQDYLERINSSLRAGNAALYEELEMERTRKLDSMKQMVELIKEANKVRGHVRDDAEGDDDTNDEG